MMKPGGKLTIRFIGYFIAFYLIIVAGVFGSIIAFFIYLYDRTGNEIQLLDAFEIESYLTETENGLIMGDNLIKRAEENNGHLYLLNKSMDVLDYSGETCSICYMSHEELTKFDIQGMHLWKSDNVYLLFLPSNQTEELFNDLFNQWKTTGTLSESSQVELNKAGISIDLYDRNWKRIGMIGEPKPLLYMPDIMANKHDLFEQKELLQASTLPDGTTFVLRMPNEFYKPFEEPFNKGMILLLLFFIGFHILLIIGTIILSYGISRRFVRPIVYILDRINQLTQFHYKTKKNPRMHRVKTGRLKRKYKLFQPVEDSLTNLAERLESNEQQIQQNERLREEWITGLSHDLKTPLSSIYGYSTMLTSSHNWSPEEMQQFAQVIQDKATYMDALIQDLTYTYQLKNRAIEPNLEQLNLPVWLEQFADSRVTVHSAKNIYVKADRLLLHRAIENIVGNAKKHTPSDTPIDITVLQVKKSIWVRITDSGPGIPKEELNHLFNRYYRGTNTKDDTNGTGLGLAIANQLIDLHNGKIHVSSNEQGTTFTIQLPRY